MNPKLTGPLFGETASGSIDVLGCFRSSHGSTFLQMKPSGNQQPPIAAAAMRNAFRAAMAEWKTLPENYRPKWPVYWRAYLAAHPVLTNRHATLRLSLAPIYSGSTPESLRVIYSDASQIKTIKVTARASRAATTESESFTGVTLTASASLLSEGGAVLISGKLDARLDDAYTIPEPTRGPISGNLDAILDDVTSAPPAAAAPISASLDVILDDVTAAPSGLPSTIHAQIDALLDDVTSDAT